MVALVIIIILLCAFGFLLFMALEAKQNNVISHHFHYKTYSNYCDPVVLFFISDIHKRIVSDELLNKVRDKMNVVVIGGDLLEIGIPLAQIEKNLDKLKALGPTFFVWGNHDHDYEDTEGLINLLKAKDVVILNNEGVNFENKICLIGVDDSTYERDNLPLALTRCPPQMLRVLISHNPNIRDKVKKEDNISLILSGHTHGGQIRILGWGLREKGGVKKGDGYQLVISNGYGTTHYPFRLGARPDALIITISR